MIRSNRVISEMSLFSIRDVSIIKWIFRCGYFTIIDTLLLDTPIILEKYALFKAATEVAKSYLKAADVVVLFHGNY